MQLTFEDLATLLPAGSIELVGNNQLKINMNQVTGEQLTLQSPVLEAVTKFMQALTRLTENINEERINLNPSKPIIQFASQSFDGSPENPELVFEIRVAVKPQSFVENLLDPTVD
jgi:hypothetical protein